VVDIRDTTGRSISSPTRIELAPGPIETERNSGTIETVETLTTYDLFTDSIRLQAFATASETHKTRRLETELMDSPVMQMQEILREIDHRYLSKTGGSYSDAWLIDKQCDLLFAMA